MAKRKNVYVYIALRCSYDISIGNNTSLYEEYIIGVYTTREAAVKATLRHRETVYSGDLLPPYAILRFKVNGLKTVGWCDSIILDETANG